MTAILEAALLSSTGFSTSRGRGRDTGALGLGEEKTRALELLRFSARASFHARAVTFRFDC